MRPAGLKLIGTSEVAVGEPAFRIVGNKVRWAIDSQPQEALGHALLTQMRATMLAASKYVSGMQLGSEAA
jgi:hypothetical protein